MTISSVFASASVNSSHTADLAFFFLSQVLMGLAVGGIKPNLSALGADQFDDFGPKGEPLKDKERFFTWYYFFINIGALLASTVLVYVQTSVSWTLGFALPTTLAIAAVAVYVVGWKGYRRLPPGGPALYQVFQAGEGEGWEGLEARRDCHGAGVARRKCPLIASPPESPAHPPQTPADLLLGHNKQRARPARRPPGPVRSRPRLGRRVRANGKHGSGWWRGTRGGGVAGVAAGLCVPLSSLAYQALPPRPSFPFSPWPTPMTWPGWTRQRSCHGACRGRCGATPRPPTLFPCPRWKRPSRWCDLCRCGARYWCGTCATPRWRPSWCSRPRRWTGGRVLVVAGVVGVFHDFAF